MSGPGRFRVRSDVMIRFLRDHCRVQADTSGHQVRINVCPVCGDAPTGGKAFRHVVNFRKQIFFCYRNDCLVDLVELVRLMGGHRTMAGAMQYLASFGEAFDLTGGEHPDPGSPDDEEGPVLRRIREKLHATSVGMVPGQAEEPEMDLPESFSADWSGKHGRAALSYARRRNVPEWFVHSGRIGYCTAGEMRGRLVFLTFEGERLVYAVGRAMSDRQSPKYLFPEVGGGELGKSRFVFNLDLWAGCSRLLVCEGTISALAVEGGVCVFGHRMGPQQAAKIARTVRETGIGEVVTLFDPDLDPRKEAHAASMLTAQGCPNVRLGLLSGGDPAEVPHEVPTAVAGSLQSGDRLSLLRARVDWIGKKK